METVQEKIEDLQKIAARLLQARGKMTTQVRDGGRRSQESLDHLLGTVYHMHDLLFSLADKLLKLAEELQKEHGIHAGNPEPKGDHK